MIKDTNYYVVFRWMTSKLGLTGNELLTYAVVYGFTQDGDTQYLGSQKYLTEAIGCSKNTAIASLEKLTEKELIIKTVETVNGVNFNRYRVNLDRIPEFGMGYQNLNKGYQKLVGGIPESGMGGIPEIGTSNTNISNTNKNNNKEYICNNNSLNSGVGIPNQDRGPIPYKEIIGYLNEKTGRDFRSSANYNQSCIKARWNEGYTLEQFKKVIDTKVAMWKGTKMEDYLRPQTLFGTKFESYLNQTARPTANSNYYNPNINRDDSNVAPEEMWNI